MVAARSDLLSDAERRQIPVVREASLAGEGPRSLSEPRLRGRRFFLVSQAGTIDLGRDVAQGNYAGRDLGKVVGTARQAH